MDAPPIANSIPSAADPTGRSRLMPARPQSSAASAPASTSKSGPVQPCSKQVLNSSSRYSATTPTDTPPYVTATPSTPAPPRSTPVRSRRLPWYSTPCREVTGCRESFSKRPNQPPRAKLPACWSHAAKSRFVTESGESVDPVERRIIAPPWRLRAEPSLSRGSSSNAPFRSGSGHCNHANNRLMRPEANRDRKVHAVGRSDRTCGRNARRS